MIDRHEDQLAALDDAIRAIALELSVERVLQLIVDRVRDVAQAQYAALGIASPSGELEQFITSGITAEQRAQIGPLPRGHGLLGLIIDGDRSILIDDIALDARRYGFPPSHPEMHAFLGTPIRNKGRTIGDLYLTNKTTAPTFDAEDLRVIERFALHAGIAIENARLHEEVQRLAIVDERQRISQDLHDSIIQSLYGISLSLEDLPDVMAEDPAQGIVRTDRAIDAIHATIRDLRNFIMGLETDRMDEADLAARVESLAAEFSANTMIDLEVTIGALPVLPADHAAHILSITSEGLSNVARHSGATRAWLDLGETDGIVRLVIGDNGHGFDTELPRSADRHGLANLRSRAEAAGGSLAIAQQARRRDDAHGGYSGKGGRLSTEPVESQLRVLVVDDHEVVREGLVAMLDRRPGFQVVAEAGTVAEALEMARKFVPELVIMDVRLPDGSGIEACRDIRAEMPKVRVVILTSYPDEEAVFSAIVAGASGYLLKQVRARDLVAALEAVGRGESLLDPAVTEKVLERVRRIATGGATDELAQLTSQEQKILLLVAEGMTNKEIAAEVFLSDKTVKNYVSSILSKLNLQRRAQAAAYVAKRHGGA